MGKFLKKYSLFIIVLLITIIVGLCLHIGEENTNSKRLIEEVEYYDSLNNYNKIYYSKAFSTLKKENKELYDSLKRYKDKLDYVIQFTYEKDYNTGEKNSKPTIIHSTIHDTITIKEPLVSKTYQYLSEPNDTFQYKLNINSYTEPNWYSLNVKTKNKFTIVNKEDGGLNHIVIDPSTNNGTVSNVTVFHKKEKQGLLKRVSFGPGITAGYDPINKQWGVVGGVTISYKLN